MTRNGHTLAACPSIHRLPFSRADPTEERLRSWAAARGWEVSMTDAVWIGALAALLLVYLVYALLAPERF